MTATGRLYLLCTILLSVQAMPELLHRYGDRTHKDKISQGSIGPAEMSNNPEVAQSKGNIHSDKDYFIAEVKAGHEKGGRRLFNKWVSINVAQNSASDYQSKVLSETANTAGRLQEKHQIVKREEGSQPVGGGRQHVPERNTNPFQEPRYDNAEQGTPVPIGRGVFFPHSQTERQYDPTDSGAHYQDMAEAFAGAGSNPADRYSARGETNPAYDASAYRSDGRSADPIETRSYYPTDERSGYQTDGRSYSNDGRSTYQTDGRSAYQTDGRSHSNTGGSTYQTDGRSFSTDERSPYQTDGRSTYQTDGRAYRTDGSSYPTDGRSAYQTDGSSYQTDGRSAYQTDGSSYQTDGRSAYQIDGSSYPTEGRSAYQTDGSSYQTDGRSAYQIDGSSYPTDGRSAYQTDGSSYQTDGRSAYQTDGSSYPTDGRSAYQIDGSSYPTDGRSAYQTDRSSYPTDGRSAYSPDAYYPDDGRTSHQTDGRSAYQIDGGSYHTDGRSAYQTDVGSYNPADGRTSHQTDGRLSYPADERSPYSGEGSQYRPEQGSPYHSEGRASYQTDTGYERAYYTTDTQQQHRVEKGSFYPAPEKSFDGLFERSGSRSSPLDESIKEIDHYPGERSYSPPAGRQVAVEGSRPTLRQADVGGVPLSERQASGGQRHEIDSDTGQTSSEHRGEERTFVRSKRNLRMRPRVRHPYKQKRRATRKIIIPTYRGTHFREAHEPFYPIEQASAHGGLKYPNSPNKGKLDYYSSHNGLHSKGNAKPYTQPREKFPKTAHGQLEDTVAFLNAEETNIISAEAACTWTMAFQAVTGSGRNVYQDFSATGQHNTELSTTMVITDALSYRDGGILDNWSSLRIFKVKMELFSDMVLSAWFIFDGKDSILHDWFSKERLINSSHSDQNSTEYIFSRIRTSDEARLSFVIAETSNPCDTECGLAMVVESPTLYACAYEENIHSYPAFLYGINTSTCSKFSNEAETGQADRLVISVLMCED